MMNMRIIYKVNGRVVVITPTAEGLACSSIVDIAKKDVPAGLRFAIVEESDLPASCIEAWIVEESDLNDGVGEG